MKKREERDDPRESDQGPRGGRRLVCVTSTGDYESDLACALWDYNSPDLWARLVLSRYPVLSGCLTFPPMFICGFVWLPAVVKDSLGWDDWHVDRELVKDRFA